MRNEWEYLLVICDEQGFFRFLQEEEIKRLHLDDLGIEGWEVVGLTWSPKGLVVLCKRPKCTQAQ